MVRPHRAILKTILTQCHVMLASEIHAAIYGFGQLFCCQICTGQTFESSKFICRKVSHTDLHIVLCFFVYRFWITGIV